MELGRLELLLSFPPLNRLLPLYPKVDLELRYILLHLFVGVFIASIMHKNNMKKRVTKVESKEKFTINHLQSVFHLIVTPILQVIPLQKRGNMINHLQFVFHPIVTPIPLNREKHHLSVFFLIVFRILLLVIIIPINTTTITTTITITILIITTT